MSLCGQKGGRHTLGAEELARDVERLAADNDNLLAVEELLRDDASKAAKQVTLAIDDDLLGVFVSFRSHLDNIRSIVAMTAQGEARPRAQSKKQAPCVFSTTLLCMRRSLKPRPSPCQGIQCDK